MTKRNDPQFDAEPHWSQSPYYERYGLQGAATVHELQKIQAAFDRAHHGHANKASENRHEGPDARLALASRPNISKRRKRRESGKRRGLMGTMMDICVQAFRSGRNIQEATPPPAPETSKRDATAKNRAAGPNKVDSGPRHERTEPIEITLSRIEAARPLLDDLDRKRKGLGQNLDSFAALQIRRYAELSKPRRDAMVRGLGNFLKQTGRGYRFIVDRSDAALDHEGTNLQLSTRVEHSFDGELRTGLRVLLATILIGGGWATLVPLSSAVAIPGALVAETNVKKVQHSTGGIIAQILVRDGMHVLDGDPVVRLDETQMRSNLQVVTKQLDQLGARISRLIAERDGAHEIEFPTSLTTSVGDKDVDQLIMSERSLFTARTKARQSQKDAIRGHIFQLEGEIAGFESQIEAKATQVELIVSELKGLQALFAKHLAPVGRLTTLQREAARLDGERGQMTSSISEAKLKISEAELQIVQVDQNFRSELLKDLRESQDKEAELIERSITAKDQLNRIDIRAPASGVIHQLAVHTVGGVISPAEVIMEIVPDADELQIEARIPPNEIDHVRLGQKSLVRFSAFNQRTTPQLEGLVSYVSADLTHDKLTNSAFYTVRVTLPGDQRRRLSGLQLISGMPAEVFLQTGSRTMMSYLFKPITDQMQRMFSEP